MEMDPGFLQSLWKTTGTRARVALQLQGLSSPSLQPREDGNVVLRERCAVSAALTGHSHRNIILLQLAFNHVLLSIRHLWWPKTQPTEPACPSEKPPMAEASLLSWCKAPFHGWRGTLHWDLYTLGASKSWRTPPLAQQSYRDTSHDTDCWALTMSEGGDETPFPIFWPIRLSSPNMEMCSVQFLHKEIYKLCPMTEFCQQKRFHN